MAPPAVPTNSEEHQRTNCLVVVGGFPSGVDHARKGCCDNGTVTSCSRELQWCSASTNKRFASRAYWNGLPGSEIDTAPQLAAM